MPALSALRRLPNVRRAWPSRDGALTFEQLDPEGRLRAGKINADGALHFMDFGLDRKLPELAPPEQGTLVVHRYERRAVIVGAEKVEKFLRAGRAMDIAHTAKLIHKLCEPTGFQAPEVLENTDARIAFSKLPGDTLHDLNEKGIPGWQTLTQIWPEFVTQQTSLPIHSTKDETGVLADWFKKASDFEAVPDLRHFGAAVSSVSRELVSGSSQPVLSHRDFHDKQLLWDGKHLGLLDSDTAVRAEAALDLGNLLAHAELRLIQGVFSTDTYIAVVKAVDALASTLQVPLERLACYLRCATLRLAFVYAFRPSSQPWFEQWVTHCLSTQRKDYL
ncbi:phosphotransferase [Corynebacterium freiburgense]|uniref:phosphotransferase n=1 Tax=Corynebacterium freiburgense TaxID=556548 RepID=UPI00040C811C|nr:phosphotransferase [Corynebacterium freiburgense]WJZ03057.1 Phosphotransferase enzyme family protein [Corynebacterium freiburgense]